ncbi:hypothetical protein [Candidatus Pantoea soli]|uniref:hypothetical protein n=1 Tax=Candidatus Pantoea soli TaxID=3098669 RepID=UPI0011A69B71|nr:hypothetical protein [Pantoea soli]
MSKAYYSTTIALASNGKTSVVKQPTLQAIIYKSVNDYEKLILEMPHFAEGLTGLMSTLVAHECRNIGF